MEKEIPTTLDDYKESWIYILGIYTNSDDESEVYYTIKTEIEDEMKRFISGASFHLKKEEINDLKIFCKNETENKMVLIKQTKPIRSFTKTERRENRQNNQKRRR